MSTLIISGIAIVCVDVIVSNHSYLINYLIGKLQISEESSSLDEYMIYFFLLNQIIEYYVCIQTYAHMFSHSLFKSN